MKKINSRNVTSIIGVMLISSFVPWRLASRIAIASALFVCEPIFCGLIFFVTVA
jgi:hypothetical protein